MNKGSELAATLAVQIGCVPCWRLVGCLLGTVSALLMGAGTYLIATGSYEIDHN